MNKMRLFVLLGLLAAVSAPAQFFKVTNFDRQGRLMWTNLLCTTSPVYSVLSATAPEGPWQPVASLTNQTAFTATNLPGSGTGAVFYQVVYLDDAPLAFDYTFDEGYGWTSVEGQISINLARQMATWDFEDTGLLFAPHPLGHGTGPVALSTEGDFMRVIFSQTMDEAVYLVGALERSGTPGQCTYTGYWGTAYWTDYSSTEPEAIGDFWATPPW